jgi:hypothetical protein
MSRETKSTHAARQTVAQIEAKRDATLLIEQGKVTRPAKNFRFDDSPASYSTISMDSGGRSA